MVIPYGGTVPQVDPTAYVQASAHVIGDVQIGPQSSLWFNTVVRGDVHYVRIGARTNIQDNSTIHVTTGRWATVVGDDVTVGHGVVLHGCRVGDGCLVGIGAIVLDGAEIGDRCLIAAGSLVTPGTGIPPGHLVLGRPARASRLLTPEELAHLRDAAQHYVAHAQRYRDQGIA
ncbi:gamma carbonic anhydrase family protein [Candidatus Binatia bacterium]|nr:gamma carbonic anhydrase family protein [Candidatus Binatia bacterium]